MTATGKLTYAAIGIALHDLFGFGHKRILRVLQDMEVKRDNTPFPVYNVIGGVIEKDDQGYYARMMPYCQLRTNHYNREDYGATWRVWDSMPGAAHSLGLAWNEKEG